MKTNMKKLILVASLMIAQTTIAQLPYAWFAGLNPNWMESNPTPHSFSWQESCVLGTSDQLPYDNCQTSTYTSGVMNTLCNGTSTVNINFMLNINLDPNNDFLYFLYSIDGGITFIIKESWTGNLGAFIYTSTIPESVATVFQFKFISNGTVNSINGSNYSATVEAFNAWCTANTNLNGAR